MSLDDRLANLRKSMPAFKQQFAEGQAKQRAANNGALRQPPCLICSKRFGSAFGAKGFKSYCPACQRRLDAGECCVMSMDGAVYLFMAIADTATEEQKLNRGKIVNVSIAEMKAIQQHLEKNEK